MHEKAATRLTVGEGEAAREIAILRRPGQSPGLFWLGGFLSDMAGTKASAVDAFGDTHGLAVTRFDYSGHGLSGGRFEDGTVSRWLEESLAVFDRCSEGQQVLIGSSMGGWLALLLAEARRETRRIAGVVLIAPAVDMTRALMWDRWTKKTRATLERDGIYLQPSSYSAEPYPITRALIEDGDRHLFGERLIETGCPVHILQGTDDIEVPAEHATRLVTRFASDDVLLTLVKGGDHRLSRPEDLALLASAIEGIVRGDHTTTHG